MNVTAPVTSEPDGQPATGGALREALLVACTGLLFALAANWLSPCGLVLARNYFPGGVSRPGLPAVSGTTNSQVFSPAEWLATRLRDEGLQLISGRQAAQLFQDPRFRQGKVVFVDARDEAEYQKGHIPGAWEFDPYRPEKYFPTVLPVCQAADRIVVYCNGGDCDDSESAALTLRDVGISTNKLSVYVGGFAEWTTNGLPVELGERDSGRLEQSKK